MRRTILLMATMSLPLLVASGVALAVTKIGDPGSDTLRGTNGADNDVVAVINDPAGKDVVSCGSGFDRVLADRADLIAPHCERVFGGFGSFFESNPERFFEGLHPKFT